ncbi:MAG: cytochrome C, partial [Gammaproteobacteria bacterium]|nr:cytochrome C [Gammaproteobacteria bacterium]
VYDEEGMLVEDYKDDVHKGLTWTENGETRPIENCNACHSRNYYNSLANTNNVDLDANHNFLKGNSDMDLRNDLDYNPNALSCEYCHDTAEEPAIPSGQDSMLNAHLEIWKANGDMVGYTADSLSRITQTHLDVVSCQACHITDKKSRGRNLPIMFRYRQEEEGDLKIVPYAQRDRYYWKDKNSNTILNKTERNSVFELRGGDTHSMPGMTMPTDEMYGVIVDPETGAELATVSARLSHGSIRFGDPEDYAGYLALRNAYNKVLKLKGFESANAVMVLTESNQYIMNHNTRPGPESLQCADCHTKKQNGSFSALIAVDSVLGETNSQDIFTLPDARLFSEGIVELDKDYMKADANGVVSINVSDILYSTRLNPSLSILNADIASVMSGKVDRISVAEAARLAGISKQAHIDILAQSGDELYVFAPVYGDP